MRLPRRSMEVRPSRRHSNCLPRRHMLCHAAQVVVACLTLVPLAGCGNGFTNQSIPEGKSVISGRVVASNNPQTPLANVVVTVYSTPQGETTPTASAVLTDAQGQFSVSPIYTGKRPNGAPPTVSSVTVAVNTEHTGYQSQKVSLLLTEARPVTVLLAVPPNGFNFNQVGSVSVTTSASSANPLPPGASFTFTAELLDSSGQPLISSTTGQIFVPSLVLQNLSLTSIGNNGFFEATGSAVGNISITGTVSLPNAQAPINSDPVNLKVANPQTVITSTSPQLGTNVPSPPSAPL